jgi:hypothetical protein
MLKIHCETKDEFLNIIQIMDDKNWTWAGTYGVFSSERFDIWDIHKENTYITFNDGYIFGNISEIIDKESLTSFDDFLTIAEDVEMVETLDEYHFHEALDRTYMIQSMVENFLCNHIVFLNDDILLARVTKISEELSELYLEIGNIINDTDYGEENQWSGAGLN